MTKEEFRKRLWRVRFTSTDSEAQFDRLWADIEAERGIVVDWKIVPEEATKVVLIAREGYNWIKDIWEIPRPAPKYRDLNYQEMHNAFAAKFFSEEIDADMMMEVCKAAGIETRVPQ